MNQIAETIKTHETPQITSEDEKQITESHLAVAVITTRQKSSGLIANDLIECGGKRLLNKLNKIFLLIKPSSETFRNQDQLTNQT